MNEMHFFIRLSVMNGFYILKPTTMANTQSREFFKITYNKY